MSNNVQSFAEQLARVSALVPRQPTGAKRKVAQPAWTRRVVTITGVKTVVNRFLPVSHEGHSNESYVDKVDLLGKTRAEFIGRKMKGIERRMHMALFRELAAECNGGDWEAFFQKHFGSTCVIPDGLCIACWNCALFGGLDARAQIATFSRVRYFDTFSIEGTEDCVGSMDNEEMGIGNQVYEDLVADREGRYRKRTAETYHLYEYVKAGVRFPFIVMIEDPTLLDVAGVLHAIRRADAHGYGKYSANHGKSTTEFLAVAAGYPRFSVLDMLAAMERGGKPDLVFDGFARARAAAVRAAAEAEQPDAETERPGGEGEGPLVLVGQDIEALADELGAAFGAYVKALG